MRIRLRYIIGICTIVLLTYGWFANAAPTLKYQVDGIEGPALKNVQTRLKLNQNAEAKKLNRKNIQELFEDSPKEIKKAIKPYGYFNASVSSRLTREGDQWVANYHINPGPQLLITELDVEVKGEGKNNKKIQELLKNLPIKQSDPFNSKKYEATKNKLLDTAQAEGYLRASLTKTAIVIHTHTYICVIVLHLDTGPRFYFGNTFFTKTPLSEGLLRRYINYKKGEPVSHDKLLTLQQLLNGSGYFSGVSATPVMEKVKNKKVPVQVNLKMQKRKSYRFGIGYGTNSGPRVIIGFDVNWVNRYGHQFKSMLKVSHIQTGLAAQYLIPGKQPAHEHYAINAAIYQQRPVKGESLTKSIGVAHIRNFKSWQRTVGLSFELERYRFDENEHYRRSKLLLPNIRFSRTKSNKTINPTFGNSFSINVMGASSAVISTVSFLQTTINYKQLFSITKNNRFIIRGDYGYTFIGHELDKLPLSKHYYTGGINGVRGYRYMGIGPGRFLVIGSAEYQRRVYGNFYGALFYDIGNAMNHFSTPYKRGQGFGVVWESPMGPLRAYLAQAVSKKDKPWRIEFSFGPMI